MRSVCFSLRLLAFVAVLLGCGQAVAQNETERDPAFLAHALFPVGVTQVRSIQSLPTADLVVLNSGHAGALRQGMMMQVLREGATPVAELILVSVRRDVSAALITSLNEGITLQAGDIAQIKFHSL